MSDWTHHIELKDLHDKSRAGALTPVELGKALAPRIRALIEANTPPIPTDLIAEAEDIAYRFEHDVETIDDYDDILSDLYDWADTELPHKAGIPFSMRPKLCWVNTLSAPKVAT